MLCGPYRVGARRSIHSESIRPRGAHPTRGTATVPPSAGDETPPHAAVTPVPELPPPPEMPPDESAESLLFKSREETGMDSGTFATSRYAWQLIDAPVKTPFRENAQSLKHRTSEVSAYQSYLQVREATARVAIRRSGPDALREVQVAAEEVRGEGCGPHERAGQAEVRRAAAERTRSHFREYQDHGFAPIRRGRYWNCC